VRGVLSEEMILNWGAKIGAIARNECTRRDQLEYLIAAVDEFAGKEALLGVATVALRKARQGLLGYGVARLVAQAMLELYEKGGDKEVARRLLGFAKWVFEALPPRPIKLKYDQLTLKELLLRELEP